MAQGNQPNNRLGGFANRKFVLINGEYWDCNVNRRRILGQVCLDEFADILLKWFLSNRSLLLRHPPMYDDGYSCQLLEEKGSLEVLKFAYDNAALVDNVDDTTLDWNFAEIVDHLRKRRNQLTHDVRSWTITRFRDFLETMKDASNYLVQPPGRCDAALEKRVNTFISKCERELDHIVQFRNLY